MLLQDPDIAPEETECYVVLEGSRLSHVTEAKRTDDGLSFTVPGTSFNICLRRNAPIQMLVSYVRLVPG